MSKCIVCECARVLKYEPPREKPPIKCPGCGRDTRHYTSMKEDDPRVKMLVDKYKSRLGGVFKDESKFVDSEKSDSQYYLASKDGKTHISIPKEGGMIGRTSIGGEELAHNGRISREHVRLIPAKRALGVMAEDVSANGTFVDGRKLTKNKPEFVVIGSVIKMGGEEFVLERAEQTLMRRNAD